MTEGETVIVRVLGRYHEATVVSERRTGLVVRIGASGRMRRVRREDVGEWRAAHGGAFVALPGKGLPRHERTPKRPDRSLVLTAAALHAVPKPSPPARDPRYLAHVRARPCAGCGAPPPSDAHHYGSRGVGQKADDYRTVPLCRRCHTSWHHRGALGLWNSHEAVEVLLRAQVDALVAWVRR